MDKIEVLTGYPPCPECGTILSMRSMPDYQETAWYCKGCGTQWDTSTLIKALNSVQELAKSLGKVEYREEAEDGW